MVSVVGLPGRLCSRTARRRGTITTILALLVCSAVQATTFEGGPAQPDAPDLSILTPEAHGRAVFQEKDRREAGYQDLQVKIEMVLRDRRGSEARRELSISQLEMADEGDRLLVVFETPKPIRGTALLSYSHVEGPDDQWLFLPALQRVKRIASRNKSGPFLSSEFAYEDLALQEIEKFDYRFLGRLACDDRQCLRVERTPRDKFSGYSREEVLLDEATLRVERIDYFDRHGRPLKVLANHEYELFEGRYWKPTRMFMENLQTGRTTELLWRNYQFGRGLSAERDFSINSLKRAR